MADTSMDREGNARRCIAQIHRDYGRSGLDDPRLMHQLLPDLLGDAPREAAILRAAADTGVAQMLIDRINSGVPVEAAANDVSILMAERNAFDKSACDWIVAEYAMALGYPIPAAPGAPAGVGVGDPTSIDTIAAWPAGGFAPQQSPAQPGRYPAPQSPAQPGGYQAPQSPAQPGGYQAPQSPAQPGGYPAQQSPGQPAGYAQPGGPPQQGGVSPHGGHPQPGGYPQQQAGFPSQPGGYPQQQAGYPPQGPYGYAPQTPPQKSRTGMIIAIGAAVVLVVVLGAVVIAATNNSSNTKPKTGAACLIGTWRSTSIEVSGQQAQSGTEILVYGRGGSGSSELQAVAITDSGSGEKFVLAGKITFTYNATDSVITYQSVNGSFTATDPTTGESASDTPTLTPDSYTCTGNNFVINDPSEVDKFVRA